MVPSPVIQSIIRSQSVISLQWSAVAGRTYRVEYSGNLAQTNWTKLTPDVLASGSTAAATNSIGTSNLRFYRVISLP